MMEKILTIIIPTYNMEKYLDKCLTSLIIDDKELMRKLEILVINDGSKDRSSEIAHEYEINYPDTFRVIDKENGNYGSCINRGLKEATGKYVKVLDADDYFDKNSFSTYLNVLNKVNADLVLNNCDIVNKYGVKTNSFNIKSLKHNRIYSFKDVYHNLSIQMHNVAYKTNQLRSIKYTQTEGISYTDQEWIYYPMITVQTIYLIDLSLYNYFIGREGQTMDPRISIKKIDDEIIIMNSLVNGYRVYKEDPIHKYYLLRKASGYLSYVYKKAIIDNTYDINKIKKFDDGLKKSNFEIYQRLNSATSNKYSYIKMWRRTGKIGYPIIFNYIDNIRKLMCIVIEFVKTCFYACKNIKQVIKRHR